MANSLMMFDCLGYPPDHPDCVAAAAAAVAAPAGVVDPVPSNNTATDTDEVEPKPDLFLQVTASTHVIEQTSKLPASTWTDVTNVTFSSATGNTLIATFAKPSSTPAFYRVRL
jgi:hypothetical protein